MHIGHCHSAPEDMPQKMPSSVASRRAMSIASSLLTCASGFLSLSKSSLQKHSTDAPDH